MTDFEYAITVKALNKSFGNKVIIRDMFLSFFYGAKIGILGPNGSGKSTLLKIISGRDNDFKGEIILNPKLKLSYLPQMVDYDDSRTIKTILLEDGLNYIYSAYKEFNDISEKLAAPDLSPQEIDRLIEKQAKAQEILDLNDAWDLDFKVEQVARALGLPSLERKFSELSGGERRRVDLAKIILSNPDILLLDEPTNHLDAESVLWLENYLKKFRGTVLAVTHDRYFLEEVAEWILELDRGNYYPFKGNYSDWLKQKERRLEDERNKDQQRKRTIQRELEWVSSTPQARFGKNKNRLKRYEELLSIEKTEEVKKLEIFIPNGPRLGTKVVDLKDIKKRVDGRILIQGLSFSIPPAAVVGVIGPNGAGKSTLLKMIAGEIAPDSGTIEIGETVVLGYADQLRQSLRRDLPVWKAVSESDDEQIKIGERWVNVRSYIARFNFTEQDQQKPVSVLSGGELNRLCLAKLLTKPCNLLLLDEPTNDLDIDSSRALEEAILNFAGSVVVVSHDRWFLDRICTHTLAALGNGEWGCFDGPPSEFFQTQQGKRLLATRFGEAFLSA